MGGCSSWAGREGGVLLCRPSFWALGFGHWILKIKGTFQRVADLGRELDGVLDVHDGDADIDFLDFFFTVKTRIDLGWWRNRLGRS